MGYESRVYIVEKRHIHERDGRIYSQVIAMFDMGKFYELSGPLRNKPETKCYFYADDGDTRITEDRYGKPLNEASVAETIAILEKIVKKRRRIPQNLPAACDSESC